MTREQIAAWVVRTRAEQGLPRHVEDDQVLTDLAQAIRDPTSTRSPVQATTDSIKEVAMTLTRPDGE